mgnify:CR=1 FL=1|tara:strand:+ start:52 stop:1719 length:1668 start_codon:yes stop_codon:yes gene_type:complete
MSELRELLKEEYRKKQKAIITPQSLMEMIEEVLEIPLPLIIREKKEGESRTFTISMIPDIEVTELGWSDVRTPEGGGAPVKGRERQLLENYLNNIIGPGLDQGLETLPEKLTRLSNFYDNPEEYLSETETRAKKIQQAVSLLVFYKTLTKIIANFNAASAGFSFESFLATLLDGVQVPANTGTIADFYAGGVDGEPVSLKLYNEATVEVGGSFVDLIGDLLNDEKGNKMTYLVVMKNLKGEKENLSGNLTFYQFDFTLENVMDIIEDTKPISAACIVLPLEGETLPDVETPARVRVTPDEVQERFAANLTALTKYAPYVLADKHFIYGTDEMQSIASGAGRLRTYKLGRKAGKEQMVQILKGVDGLENITDEEANQLMVQVGASLRQAINDIEQLRTARKEKVAQVLPGLKGYKVTKGAKGEKRRAQSANIKGAAERSRIFYNDLTDTNSKKQALLKTNGYLNEMQFSVNKSEVFKLAKPMATLEIGTAALQTMLTNTTQLLNSEVFGIFQALESLSDNLNGFFASGLADDAKATEAITDAQDIETKTEKVKSEK